MRAVQSWRSYDRMAASGEYGSLLSDAGELSLTEDGWAEVAFFRKAQAGRESVLDLGCGPGFPLVALAGSVGRLCGVDAAPAMLALARRNLASLRIRNAALVRALLDGLPFADATFDGVAICGALGSVADPVPVLRELARVARPGALVACLEQDFRRRLVPGAPREERFLERREDGLALRVVRYLSEPYRIREERYIIGGDSALARSLQADPRWQQGDRVAMDLSPGDLPAAAVIDAVVEEEAQFDPETLRECFEGAGFALVAQRVAPSYGVPHLFSTFCRAG